jgi:hypothetical protein
VLCSGDGEAAPGREGLGTVGSKGLIKQANIALLGFSSERSEEIF